MKKFKGLAKTLASRRDEAEAQLLWVRSKPVGVAQVVLRGTPDREEFARSANERESAGWLDSAIC